MLPTEFELCRQYQVSRQTVRTALKSLADRGRIQRRQGCGSKVVDPEAHASASHKTVAIVTTYISDYVFPRVLREAEAVLSAHDCTVELYATSNQLYNERRVLTNLLQEEHLDGVLVEGTKTALPNPNLDLYRKLQEKGVKLVFFHADYQELNAVSVLDDNYGGGRLLTEYLIYKNHRRIAGVFKSDDVQGHQRFAGYSAALCRNGLPLDDRHVYWYQTEDRPLFSTDSPLWERSLKAVLEGCTAVVCYNDEVAGFLVRCLLAQGVRIPEQMAVVSFDNSHYSTFAPCQITSLSHGEKNAGRIAAELLMQLFAGEAVSSQTLPWTLMEKESS